MPNVTKLSKKKIPSNSEEKTKRVSPKEYTSKYEPETIPENIDVVSSTKNDTIHFDKKDNISEFSEEIENNNNSNDGDSIDFDKAESIVKISITKVKTIAITVIVTLFIIGFGYLIGYWGCIDQHKREIYGYNNMEASVSLLKEKLTIAEGMIIQLTTELTTVKEGRDAKVNRLKSKAEYLEEEVKKTRSFGCFAENGDFVKNGKIVNQPPQKFICRNGLWEEIKTSK